MGTEGVVTFLSWFSCNPCDSNYSLSPCSDGHIFGEFVLLQQKLTSKGKLGRGIEDACSQYSVPESSFCR